MEKMAVVQNFMDSPLVTWVKTFNESGEPVDFQELCDGVYLNDVLFQIDQRDVEQSCKVHRMAKDTNAKLQNWALLIRNIRAYYQDILQQLVVMELPNVVSIVKEPAKESSLKEMRKVLLLLLGCAVQCPRKEDYICAIKKLDLQLQKAIVENIQEITDSWVNILNVDYSLKSEEDVKNYYNILRNVVHERHGYAENLIDLTQERDYCKNELKKKGVNMTPPPALEQYHMGKQLTDCKNRLNAVTEDLEEKTRTVVDLRDELKEATTSLNKYKSENLMLSKDAKAARTYRDELDSFKEKAVKVERYEKELRKYKEMVNELDFYKSRVEELREDNTALAEAKSKSEEQMGIIQKRNESIMDELVRGQLQLEQLNMEKDQVQKKMQELIEENSALEFEKSKMKEGYGSGKIRRILSYSSSEFLNGSQLHLVGHPISDELNDSMTSQVTRLEMENDELRHDLDETKQRLNDAQRELERVISEMEKEYKQKQTELDQQALLQRKHTSRQLSKEYEEKMQVLEKQSAELKTKVFSEHHKKLTEVEKERENSEKQLVFVRDAWAKDKEQYSLLLKLNQNMVKEKEQLKLTIQTLQTNSKDQIMQLEKEIDNLIHNTNAIQRHTSKISNLCDTEINKDNAQYILMRASAEAKQHHRSKGNDSAPESSSGFISPNSDIYRKKHRHDNGDRSRGIPERPNTVLGVPIEHRTSTPIKGVVAPQRRSASPVPLSHTNSEFSRNDKLRMTMTGSQAKQASRVLPFCRSEPIRQTMPERKKTGYVAPERRKSSHKEKRSSQKTHSTDKLNSSFSGSVNDKYLTSSRDKNTSLPHDAYNKGYTSDRDSGCATSPESPGSDKDAQDAGRHFLTSVRVVSSETMRKEFRTSAIPKMGEKWRVFVDKIVELQDKNQQLIVENSELRRKVNSVVFATERMEMLEKKNLQLEIENRKLKTICESLQLAMNGMNPYDKRMYYFHSHV